MSGGDTWNMQRCDKRAGKTDAVVIALAKIAIRGSFGLRPDLVEQAHVYFADSSDERERGGWGSRRNGGR